MSPEVGLLALLHMSAVVGALAAAYVGLDRSRGGHTPNEGAYEAARGIAKELLQQLGIGSAGSKNVMRSRKWGKLSIFFPTYVICIVARESLNLGVFHEILHFIYRQYHIPFFCYFRRRVDICVTVGIAIGSLSLFFLLAGVLIWRKVAFEDAHFLKPSFVVLFGVATWLLVQGLLSLLATEKRVTNKCNSLHLVITRRLKRRRDDAQKTLDEF